jgi:hypothetical protein
MPACFSPTKKLQHSWKCWASEAALAPVRLRFPSSSRRVCRWRESWRCGAGAADYQKLRAPPRRFSGIWTWGSHPRHAGGCSYRAALCGRVSRDQRHRGDSSGPSHSSGTFKPLSRTRKPAQGAYRLAEVRIRIVDEWGRRVPSRACAFKREFPRRRATRAAPRGSHAAKTGTGRPSGPDA